MKLVKDIYNTCGRKLGAFLYSPTKAQAQACLFVVGLGLLTLGVMDSSFAQTSPSASVINYNDERINDTIEAILGYIEGSFGALVMVCAGLGAIISAAFGGYKAALGLLVVAVGAFILRSLVATFFDTTNLDGFS